jgi:glycosyltransferase involved in cell wall biosynthesis
MHAERGFPQPVGHLPYFLERCDADWQHPAPRPHPRPYCLFVGRLERIKGLHTLIDAWRAAPDLELDLLVAGEGGEANALRARAAGDERIRFLGPVAPADLGRHYVHALTCLVPSLTYETFGIVIIEALARKTPVVARDRGGLTEVVEESGGGVLYRTDEEMLAAVRRLAASPGLRAELGERGYQSYLRLWTREAHLAHYFELLAETALARLGRVPWRSPGMPANGIAAESAATTPTGVGP